MSTVVCFKIGRGGHFHNAGHVSFLRYEDDINKFTGDLFSYYEFENEFRYKYKGYPNIIKELESFFETGDGEADQATMDLYPIFRRLGITLSDLGDRLWFTCGGSCTGLEVDNDGTGTIDIDGGYNTTYCKLITDCDNDELELIVRDEPYNLVSLLEDAGYDNVEIFEAFEILDEMIDNGDKLRDNGIEEISEEEYDEMDDEYWTRKVGDKFYKRQ